MYKIIFYILTVILLILLLIFYNFVFSNKWNKYETKNIKLDELQTGDIILTDFQNFNSFLVTICFKENFMHPSIVLREGDEVYILDYLAEKGLIKRSLANWYGSGEKNINLYNKLNCSEIEREKVTKHLNYLYEKLNLQLSEGPPGFDLSWKRFWWPEKSYNKPIEFNKMVCCELMAHFLMEAGIIKKNRNISSFLPRDYINMNGFTTADGFNYNQFNLINNLLF